MDEPRLLTDWLRGQASSGWKLPVLAGLLLAAGYYSPWPLLNVVAFSPLLLRLDVEPGRGFRSGLLFGLATYGIGLHFFLGLVWLTWLSALLWLGFTALIALRTALQVMVVAWLRRRTGASFGLLLPIGWLPAEWLQTKIGDLRMSGDHVAYGLTGSPFTIQFADLVGSYGVGLVLLATAGLVHEVVFPRPRRRRGAVLALATLITLVLAYDTWAWFRTIPSAGRVQVAIVQPNVPLAEKRDAMTGEAQWATLERQTREAAAAGAELVVWPESARPTALVHWLTRDDTFAMPEVQDLARELGVSMLVGAEYARVRGAEDYDLYNAALAVRADGTLETAWAAKAFLVPFVEALPYRAVFGSLVEGRGGEWQWVAGAFRPGPRGVTLDLARARIGVLVCFEQLFADLSRELRDAGADLQVVITNDAWWGRTAFQGYQADALRLRAIENRTSIVRVANTGISGFIDAHGRYAGRTALFEPAVEVASVERHPRRTVYDRIGDAVMLPVFLALGVAAGIAYRAGRRGVSGPSS